MLDWAPYHLSVQVTVQYCDCISEGTAVQNNIVCVIVLWQSMGTGDPIGFEVRPVEHVPISSFRNATLSVSIGGPELGWRCLPPHFCSFSVGRKRVWSYSF